MAMNNKKVSNLEAKGKIERDKEILRSNYNSTTAPYSSSHIDAKSDPTDENKYLGKGTDNGGHQHYVPDSSKSSTSYNYSSLDTSAGGGAYDIHGYKGNGGRNRLVKINIYSENNAYGPNSIETDANINDGQYVISMK